MGWEHGACAQALSFGKQHWAAGGAGRAEEIFLRELPTHLLLRVPSPLGSSCPLLPSPCLPHLHLSAALLKLSFAKPLARRKWEGEHVEKQGLALCSAQSARRARSEDSLDLSFPLLLLSSCSPTPALNSQRCPESLPSSTGEGHSRVWVFPITWRCCSRQGARGGLHPCALTRGIEILVTGMQLEVFWDSRGGINLPGVRHGVQLQGSRGGCQSSWAEVGVQHCREEAEFTAQFQQIYRRLETKQPESCGVPGRNSHVPKTIHLFFSGSCRV